MPSDLLGRGKIALQKVKDQLLDRDLLKAAIGRADPKADITSCAMTAGVLGNVISSNTTQVVQGMHPKSQAERAATVSKLLNSAEMVAVSVTPDHHFILFPIDVGLLVILQGFQGAYDLRSWFRNRGGGVIRKDEFDRALLDLVSLTEGTKMDAALKLFSYKLAVPNPEEPSAKVQRVEGEIRKWFQGRNVSITNIAYKKL